MEWERSGNDSSPLFNWLNRNNHHFSYWINGEQANSMALKITKHCFNLGGGVGEVGKVSSQTPSIQMNGGWGGRESVIQTPSIQTNIASCTNTPKHAHCQNLRRQKREVGEGRYTKAPRSVLLAAVLVKEVLVSKSTPHQETH